MTTTAAPELQQIVRDRLSASPRKAQFASIFLQATQGTLSHVHAMAVLRQLGTETHYAADDPQPKRGPGGSQATATSTPMASEAQMRYAADLLRTRVSPDERVTGSVKTAAVVLAEVDASGQMSKALARNVIDSYKDRPRVVQAAPKPAQVADRRFHEAASAQVTEPGIYQVGDDIYKVQKSRQSGRLYAQKLVDGKFDYDAGYGAMRIIRAEHLMTTDQAKAFGMRFGMCVNGHPLSDRTSRYFGYGEKCAANNGWAYDAKMVPADFE